MAEVKYTDSDTLPDKVVLRAWPKMLFIWPSAFIALAAGIGTYLTADTTNLWEFWGSLFLTVFALNLMIVTFEFPRSTSLTLILACVALAWIFVELNRRYNIIAPLRDFIEALQLSARPDFFFGIFVVYVLLLIGMFISTRFNYWEISNNELIHHKGLMQDVERYSTDGLRYSKQITDFFEYLIGGSGRLVVQTPSIGEPIVLENVIGINRVARTLDLMLESQRVVVESTPAQPVQTQA